MGMDARIEALNAIVTRFIDQRHSTRVADTANLRSIRTGIVSIDADN